MKNAAHDAGFIIIVVIVIVRGGIRRRDLGVSEIGRHPAGGVLFRLMMMESARNHINRQISE